MRALRISTCGWERREEARFGGRGSQAGRDSRGLGRPPCSLDALVTAPPLAVCWRLTLAEGHCCPLGGSQQHSLAPIAPMKSVVDHSRETGIEKLLRREVL